METSNIAEIHAFEILDSRANPTVSVEIIDTLGHCVQASVPSGASTGIHEALELRDHDLNRYGGKGVLKAVENIETIIAPAIVGMSAVDPTKVDERLIAVDGTENKSNLGANAILAVSLAARKLQALNCGHELFDCFEGTKYLPVPMLNVLNGGAHAGNNLDIQEFMIMPHGFRTFSAALQASVEVYHALANLLKKAGKAIGIGDEGGFAPSLDSDEEALELLVLAIEKAGYKAPDQFVLALDVAASEWKSGQPGLYRLPKKNITLTTAELIDYYRKLADRFPLRSIEDGLDEDDFEGFRLMTTQLPGIQLVGDDLFVTSAKRLKQGIDQKFANAILIKYNQVGSINETLETIGLAQSNGYKTIISHRSGETDETFIADLAVGTGALEIKTGAPARFERTAKYNRLLEIEAKYGLPYAGKILKL